MSVTYIDTSALVRLLLHEGDSAPIEQAMQSGPASSILIRLELSSAIFRRWRSGEVSEAERDVLLGAADAQLLPAITLLPLDATVLQEAEEIVRSHAVRTLDALHLGTAVVAARHARRQGATLDFCTADQRQADAATVLFGAPKVVLVPPLR